MKIREQDRVRVVLQRAGTSKGLFLHAGDVPAPSPDRDRLLSRLMGSPDVLQIDGLGGSRPITSKIAIIAPSSRSDADVDYTFAQVDIATSGVGYDGNCGNMASGVGPFAIDEGLVEAREGMTRVRIYNTNTDRLIVSDVPVRGGLSAVQGDHAIAGVPGTGAEIAMNWAGTVGAATGHLLPTGKAVDQIVLENGRRINVSLFYAANPCVWVRGADIGLSGTESRESIDANDDLRATVGELRAKAAVMFGFLADWRLAETRSPGLPMIGLVSPPVGYATINGQQIARSEMDLRLHLIFMGVLHESIAGTASICLAAAAKTPGSIVYEVTEAHGDDCLRVGHPSGVTPTKVRARMSAEPPFVIFDMLGFSRTSRRLMDGVAYYPHDRTDSDFL